MTEITKIKIQGTEFILKPQQKQMMKFFEQSEAIENNSDFVPSIDLYPVELF
jgi:hypothetical protein